MASKPRWLRTATFVVLGGVLLGWLWPLLAGESLFWGLPSLQFYPWRSLAFSELRAGRMPLWNPYNGGGVPLLANYQTAVFYPPNWLHLLLPDVLAMNILAIAHVVWAAVGMWRFSGCWRLPDFGRGISTLAFALGGYLIARLGSFPTVAVAAWFPWLFLLIHRLVERQSIRAALTVGLGSAMVLLAGHAQTAYYAFLASGLYAIWLALTNQGAWRERGRTLLLFALGLTLGVGLAAVQLVPTAELLARSARANGLHFEWTTNFSYSLARALTLVAPNLYGTPANGTYLTEGAYFEDAAYLGLLPLVAALAAVAAWLIGRFKDEPTPLIMRAVPFWGSMAVFAFLIALGKNGFLFPFLYRYVPTFRAFQGPVRWMILAVFALAMLAGIGVSYAWGRGKWVVFWSRLALVGSLGLVIIAAVVAPRVLDTNDDVVVVMIQALLTFGVLGAGCAFLTLTQPETQEGWRSVAWQLAVIGMLGLDLFFAFRGLNPTVPAEFFAPRQEPVVDSSEWLYMPRMLETRLEFETYFTFKDYRIAGQHWPELRAALLPDMNIVDRVPMFNNFDPLDTQVHAEAVEALESQLSDGDSEIIVLTADQVVFQEPFGREALEVGAGVSLVTLLLMLGVWVYDACHVLAAMRQQGAGG